MRGSCPPKRFESSYDTARKFDALNVNVPGHDRDKPGQRDQDAIAGARPLSEEKTVRHELRRLLRLRASEPSALCEMHSRLQRASDAQGARVVVVMGAGVVSVVANGRAIHELGRLTEYWF